MAFDPEPYAAKLRELNDRERARTAGRAARERDAAGRIACRIGKSDACVRAVYLFGSPAGGVPERADFDIDLALKGGDVYAAQSLAEGAPVPCDVVSLERLPGHVRDRIHASGVVLYRRGQCGRDQGGGG